MLGMKFRFNQLFITTLILLFSHLSFGQDLNYRWAQHVGGQNLLEGKAVNIDMDGNVISGGTWGDNVDFDPPNNLDTVGSSTYAESIFIVKNDYYGNYLWSFTLESVGSNNYDLDLADIETDQAGNIYIGGSYRANFDLDPSPTNIVMTTKTGNTDAFLAKYSSDGEYLWSVLLKSSSGGGVNLLKDIEIDHLNNVFITGSFEHYVDFDPSSAIQSVNGSSNSIFVSKYSSSGGFLDMHYFYSPGAGDSYPTDMAVDSIGSVYVTGALNSYSFYLNGFTYPNGSKLVTKGFGDIFLIKLDFNLDVNWAHGIGSSNSDKPYAMEIDDSANVYITGGFSAAMDMDPSVTGVLTLSKLTTSNFGIFIAKYDSAGAIKWAKEFGGKSNTGKTIDLDAENNVYVSLILNGTSYLNPGVNNLSVSAPISGLTIIKLNPQGIAIGSTVLEGVSFPNLQASIDVDNFGNVAFTGRFSGQDDLDPSTGTANFSASHHFDAITGMYAHCDIIVDSVMSSYNYSVCIGDTLSLFVDSTSVSNVVWSNNNTGFNSGYFAEDVGYVLVGSECVYYFYIDQIENIFDTTVSACDSFTWSINNQTYYQSGTYIDTISSINACDSVFILHLQLNASDSTQFNITNCFNYYWSQNGLTYYSSGIYKDTVLNQIGCDSILTLDLTINFATTGTEVITACDSYQWINGVTYYSSNSAAMDTLTNSLGCDSIVTLDLTINFATAETDVIMACDFYQWINGVTYYSSNNTAMDTLTNSLGCDSIVTLDLTINFATTATDVISACDSYQWINGVTYYSSNNTAMDTLTNSLGCDSIVTLDLTINFATAGTDVITACDSLGWINGVMYYSSNNTAKDTLVNALGCDSIVTLDLTINFSTAETDVITACDSYQWINGATYYSSNNTAMDTLTNSLGCDSIVTLDLTINYTTTATDVIATCDSLTWIDGVTYFSNNNTAMDTLTTVSGCDSVLTLNLTINTIDSTVIQSMDTLTALKIGASYQWMDCNTNTLISGAVSQQFVPTVTGSYRVEITEGACVDTSACMQVFICDIEAAYTFTNNGLGDIDFTDISLGTYTQVYWSFGDGNTSTIANPSHVYHANGNYVVVLTLNDSIASTGCLSYFMDTISVTGISSPVICQAGFSVYYDSVNASVNVVHSSVGTNLSYLWDFGDGSTSTLQFPVHSYLTNGPFNLCLSIDNGNGCTDTYCDSVSNTGVWFRASGFDLNVEGAEPVGVVNINLSNNINIYPNPVHDQVNIEIANWPTNGVEIVVRDITGKQIYTREVAPVSNKETIQINTSKWAKGTYFIEVRNNLSKVIEKIVIQ